MLGGGRKTENFEVKTKKFVPSHVPHMFKISTERSDSSFQGTEKGPRLGAFTHLGPSSWPGCCGFEIPVARMYVEGIKVGVYSAGFRFPSRMERKGRERNSRKFCRI